MIFNKIYHFLLEEALLNPHQSGFCPSDSCINQLFAITHQIFEVFDCNPPLEVRSFFLNISKAFHKVWYEGLFYKLKSRSISGELYNFFEVDSKGYFKWTKFVVETSFNWFSTGFSTGSTSFPCLY